MDYATMAPIVKLAVIFLLFVGASCAIALLATIGEAIKVSATWSSNPPWLKVVLCELWKFAKSTIKVLFFTALVLLLIVSCNI